MPDAPPSALEEGVRALSSHLHTCAQTVDADPTATLATSIAYEVLFSLPGHDHVVALSILDRACEEAVGIASEAPTPPELAAYFVRVRTIALRIAKESP
jgi:hypothetical protein